MTCTKPRSVILLAALLALLTMAAGAHARATVSSFSSTGTFTAPAPDDCRGGLPGTITGTDTVKGQFEDTYPPTQGFYFRGTDNGTYRIAFEDGSYAIGSYTVHFTGGGPINPQGTSFDTSTSTVLDTATVYQADGTQLGREIIHASDHVTAEDLPPLGPSDNDVIRVTFDRFRLSCL
jgi:hypothetical protein